MIRGLLKIEILEYTSKDIADIFRENKKGITSYMGILNYLPKYCVDMDENIITETEYYFQFWNRIEDDDIPNKTYLLFNYLIVSEVLQQELDGDITGADIEQSEIVNILKQLSCPKYNPHRSYFGSEMYLVYQTDYTGDGVWEDYDSQTYPIGYLDSNMNLVEVKLK